jgi:type VI secretion system protein ImpF
VGFYPGEMESALTVMDRLLLNVATGEIGARSFDPIRDSIVRDLDVLLNTRRQEDLVPPEFEQCMTSILNFGVLDFAHSVNLNSPLERNRVCRSMEEAIRRFEPRLRNVSVTFPLEQDRKSHLRFQLHATIDFLSEREVFDMGLKCDTGEMSVSPSES